MISTVCSLRVMLASRHGRALRIPASAWRVDVLPPTEAAFYSGARTYRCVANTSRNVLPLFTLATFVLPVAAWASADSHWAKRSE